MTNGMMAAVAKAAGLNEEADVKIDAGFMAQHFPDIAAAFKAEGAKAERERIAAIDEAALPGHEELVAKAKAEGMNAGELALAIVSAEKASRATMHKSLDADESKMKGLRPEPANGAATPADPLAGLTGETLWKSEFSGSSDLKAEFGSEDSYLAFKRAEANGRVRILNKKSA